jgi:triacylglycerol lipase
MKSKNLVDPQLEPMIAVFPAHDFSDANIKSIREKMAAMMKEMLTVKTEGVSIQEQYIDASGFQLRILVYTPQQTDNSYKPALLHVHGGGYVVGSPEDFDGRNQMLCHELGAVIISVDYRLAPENPFPQSIEDAYAALKWLFAQASVLGVDQTKIAVYGESSGGGLAASLAILARDRKEINICHQFLIYPMLDDRTSIDADPNPFTGQFIWINKSNYYGWKSLLGQEPGGKDVSAYAAAARVSSMHGLAPAYICVGALDLFLDENMTYAKRLIRAGIPTELHVYPGGIHGLDTVTGSSVSEQFYTDLIRAMKKALVSPVHEK